MNAWQLMVSARFPVDVLLTLGLGVLAGFAWSIGARMAGKLL